MRPLKRPGLIPVVLSLATASSAAAADSGTETSSPPAAPTVLTLPPLTWYGDFRYRFEKVGQEKSTPSNTIQNRIRARMGLKSDLGDNTFVDFRLSTGPGRASTNQTLGANNSHLSNYAINLDRAYFRWGFLPGLTLSGGRIPNPFWLPGGNDLMWDADINFDSTALFAEANGPVFSPFGTVAMTWLNKVTSGSLSDTKLASFQAGTRVKLNDRWKLGAHATYHRFISIAGRTNPFGSSAAASAFSGNTVTGAANNQWVNGYDVLSFGPEIQFRAGEKPVTVYGEFLRNLAVGDENKGWNAGVRYGELKNKGDVQVCYDYRRLEKDATVDTFTDADSVSGGTDMRSHRFCASYKVGRAWHAGTSFFFGDKFLADRSQTVGRNKIQLDFVFYF